MDLNLSWTVLSLVNCVIRASEWIKVNIVNILGTSWRRIQSVFVCDVVGISSCTWKSVNLLPIMTSTTAPEEGHVNEGSSSSRRTSASDNPSITYYYDNVTVSLVPEKKGLFLKHSEYEVHILLILRPNRVPIHPKLHPIPDQMPEAKLLCLPTIQWLSDHAELSNLQAPVQVSDSYHMTLYPVINNCISHVDSSRDYRPNS